MFRVSFSFLALLQDTARCRGAGAKQTGCIFFVPGTSPGYRPLSWSGRKASLVHLFRSWRPSRIPPAVVGEAQSKLSASFLPLAFCQDTDLSSVGEGILPGASFSFLTPQPGYPASINLPGKQPPGNNLPAKSLKKQAARPHGRAIRVSLCILRPQQSHPTAFFAFHHIFSGHSGHIPLPPGQIFLIKPIKLLRNLVSHGSHLPAALSG